MNPRKTLIAILQVGLTLALLYWVLHEPEKRAEIFTNLRRAHLWWFMAGVGVYFITEVLSVWRQQVLFAVAGIRVGNVRLFVLMMIGLFFNIFLPGSTGGDVVKTYFLLKETPGQKAHALLAVIVDRVTGVLGLVLAAGATIAWKWRWLMNGEQSRLFVWTALAVLAGSVLGLGLSFVITGTGLLHRLPERMPGRTKLLDLAAAWNLYGKAWRPSLGAVVISVALYFCYFAVFVCAAKAFQHAGVYLPTIEDMLAVLPVTTTITNLPVSVGGLGLREKLFEVMFEELTNILASTAVLISSTGWLMKFALGLVGGVMYAFYRPSEHARVREMRAEVAELEKTVADDTEHARTGKES